MDKISEIYNANYGYLASTIACIGDGIISTDINARIVFINQAASELTGWSVEDAVGQELRTVMPIQNDQEPVVVDLFKAAVSTGRKVGLTRNSYMVSKAGAKIFISASCAPNLDESREITGAVIAFRDITRIRQMDQDLMNERNNFRTIFESSPLGIAIVDADVKIKEVNPAFLKLFQKDYLEIINDYIGNYVHCINSFSEAGGCGFSEECHKCQIRSMITEVIKAGKPQEIKELRYSQWIDNMERGTWFDINFALTRISGENNVMLVINDISDQKKIENEIKESKIKYQSLFMNMNSGFAYFHNICDENESVVDLEFVEVNSAFEEMFDIKLSDVKGRKLSEQFSEFYAVFRNDIQVPKHEADILNRRVKIPEYFEPGLGRWFSISTYRSAEGYLAAIIDDVTNRKNADAEMSRARDNAENANKAKSQFLANMSHEIRTPLNGMVGMLDLTLQSELSADDRDNLIIAKSCSSSLLKVINDILDFSKMEAGKLTLENIIFNLNDLVDDVTKMHRIKAEQKGIGLSNQLSIGLPENLIGDPSRLKQVLNNLLSNAIKFTDAGDVTLKVKKYSRMDDIVELLFAVQDSGIGIPQEKLELLFKSFSQVDSSYTRKFGGTGLGLVISKQLVELMGGRIWVESKENEGSTFFFTIKMSIGHKGDLQVNEKLELSQMPTASKVLFVEDDKINQMVVEIFLKQKGHSISFANNGLEALKLLEKEQFDVILMDIQMPVMDGLTATQEIRRREKENGTRTPIIAVTAYALKGDKEKFLAHGMDGYISKPIDNKLLFELLDKFGKQSAKTTSQLQKQSDSLLSVTSPAAITATTADPNSVASKKSTVAVHTAIQNETAAIVLDVNGTLETTEEKLAAMFPTRENVINDEETINKLMEDIARQLLVLKKAMDQGSFTIMEGAANHIKTMATRIDVLPIKNYAFKIELATRKKSLKDAEDALRVLELEFFKLRMNKINNRVEEKR